jgi:hypothetical protein
MTPTAATETIEQMRTQLYQIRDEERALSDRRRGLEQQLAAAIAEKMGVKIGTIVRENCSIGYGPKRKEVIKRYRVVSISLSSYKRNDLSLKARTIRKDGSDGEVHELWRDWEVEK